MHLIRCDQCAKELNPRTAEYLTVTREGLFVLVHGAHPGPWNFCSWRCVAVYADAHG